ncbi:MAG: NADH-quinone oxidoreductase subunit NuoE [Deltaproteobacteria bacterium]|nr:NADH-quinone oxidoreductase subunit NuoE [Deltaproteobacteria bacterium]
MAFQLTPEREQQLPEILARYPTKMAACLPLLHLAQEQNGWVSDDVIAYVAERLELSAAHVFGVATFYSLYHTHPVGKHHVWVCRTLSCALNGADAIVAHCEERLGIHVGETTADGQVTLHTAECLASCGTAPMMQIDCEYHENLSPEKVDVLLDRLRQS